MTHPRFGPRQIALSLILSLAAVGLVACGSAGSSNPGSSNQGVTPPPSAPPRSADPVAPGGHGVAVGTPGIIIGPGPQAVYSVQAQARPGTCRYRAAGSDPLPDPACTPGAINPQVTQATIGSTICRSGWTSTIRPPSSITGAEKRGSAAAYSYTGSFTTGEYDHLIPLELGGDPNDPANLWLQPNDRPGATSTFNSKDTLESVLRRLVCSGRLALADARLAIATDWVAAARRYAN